MKQTIDFYSGVLGMPLIKTLDLPNGMGQMRALGMSEERIQSIPHWQTADCYSRLERAVLAYGNRDISADLAGES